MIPHGFQAVSGRSSCVVYPALILHPGQASSHWTLCSAWAPDVHLRRPRRESRAIARAQSPPDLNWHLTTLPLNSLLRPPRSPPLRTSEFRSPATCSHQLGSLGVVFAVPPSGPPLGSCKALPLDRRCFQSYKSFSLGAHRWVFQLMIRFVFPLPPFF